MKPRILGSLRACVAVLAAAALTCPQNLTAGFHAGAAPARRDARPLDRASLFRDLPLMFEHADDAFVARGNGYALELSPSRMAFTLGASSMRLLFRGANPDVCLEAVDQQTARVSYFLGSDPAKWRSNVSVYGRVLYRDLYPGIDLEFHGSRSKPEFDFVVNPGADPALIQIELEGAEKIETPEPGRIGAVLNGAAIELSIPRIYQPDSGGEADTREIHGGFHVRADGRIGFDLDEYAADRTLIIDPVVDFSTYLGGVNGDNAYDVAIDSQGNIYVAGVTHEVGFPHTDGAVTGGQGHLVDGFVAKFNPTGTELLYGALIGGTGEDQAHAIVVDEEGNVYLTGNTFSTDFPHTPNAPQPVFSGGNTDAFVVKLSADASQLLFSTYLGGSRQELPGGIAVDAAGHIFVSGATLAEDFPVTDNAVRSVKEGISYDGFVTSYDPASGAMLASTLVGGSDRDDVLDMAVDPAGDVVIAGTTLSADFPTTEDAFQQEQHAITTAFVAKLDPDLSELRFSTYLGGSVEEFGQSLAVDESGDIYIGGRTRSRDFPVTEGAFQTEFVRGDFLGDAFVTKMAGDGSKLIWSTYYGGRSDEEVNGLAVDPTGQVTITGGTGSSDLPLTDDAPQKVIRGIDDIYIARLSADGSRILFASLFGGSSGERSLGLAADKQGGAVAVGLTVSYDFPISENAYQKELLGEAGGGDALVVRIGNLFTPVAPAGGVVNAASMTAGPIAPGELITIFGVDVGPQHPASLALTADGLVDTSVANARVLFDGAPGPMIFASGGQSSVVVPYAVAGSSSVQMQVEYLGQLSEAVELPVVAASPALFTLNSQGFGAAAAFNEDFQLNTKQNPIARGSVIVLYGTGEGITDNPVDGLPAGTTLPKPVGEITVSIGGRPAEVLYAGGAPGLVAGVMQINARVPADVTPGDAVPVVISSGGVAGPGAATISVR